MSLQASLFSHATLSKWIRETDPSRLQVLWDMADRTRAECHGSGIHLRGIVEFSNRCVRRCSYCGINAENDSIERYVMSAKALLLAIESIAKSGCQTVVIQSGEDPDLDEDWMAELITFIKNKYDLAVTLSLGEKPISALAKWKQAGADRYLLKIETSNPNLFKQHHPSGSQGFAQRVEMIKTLQGLGYETGSGTIIGLPGQTYRDLIHDLHFLKDLELDMIAMGPYQPLNKTCHAETMGLTEDQVPNSDLLTHVCLALVRLMNPGAHIPATAALAASQGHDSRWSSLNHGANVIMPNFTPHNFKELYAIYPSDLRSNSLDGEALVENISEQLNKMGRPAILNSAVTHPSTIDALSSLGA